MLVYLDSNHAIAQRHRVNIPNESGTRHFISLDGEKMTDNDDNRTWDACWRMFRGRHNPYINYYRGDMWCPDDPWQDYDTPRRYARAALSALRSWYKGPSSPSSRFV